MRFLLFIIILQGFSLCAIGQTSDTQAQNNRYLEERKRELERIDLINRSNALDKLSSSSNDAQLRRDDRKSTIIRKTIYRKSTKEELERMSLTSEEKSKYSNFLKWKNTNLLKLVKDLGCDEFSNQKKSDNAICQSFSIPGGGSGYSFRRKDYQQWKLADLLYDGRFFFAYGEMAQSFLVDIGKVDLDKVNAETNGVKFIFSFLPKDSVKEVDKQNSLFFEGVKEGEFSYHRYLPTVKGNTYILRSIAYRGVITRMAFDLTYNELDYDERKDVVIAFTVLDIDFNETVTILWKELQRKDSPKL